MASGDVDEIQVAESSFISSSRNDRVPSEYRDDENTEDGKKLASYHSIPVGP